MKDIITDNTVSLLKARLKLAEDRGNDLAMANAHLKRVLETLGAPVEWKERVTDQAQT